MVKLKPESKTEPSPKQEPTHYTCPRCKTSKPAEDFYKAAPGQRGTKSPYCKVCSYEKLFILKQKQKLNNIGPEVYLKQIEHEREQLDIKMNLVVEYLKVKGEKNG